METQAKGGVRRATAALLTATIGVALCNGTTSVMANQIIDDFGLVSAQQGLMASCVTAGSLIAVLSLPLLQGRVAKLVMLVLGTLSQAVALAVIGVSPVLAVLLAGCVVMGMAGGWVSAYNNTLMVDIHQKNSSRYLGMLHGFYAIGSIVAPLILQGLLFVTAWRNVYLVLAVLVLGVAVVNILGLRSCRQFFQNGNFKEQKLSLAQVKRFFSDRVSVLAVVCMLFYGGAQIGLTSWVVRYMAVRFDAAALGSVAVSAYWVTAAFSRIFAPRLKVNPIKLVMAGTAITALAHTIGVLSGVPALMVAAAAITGLTSGFAIPMLISVSVSRHPGGTSFATTITMLSLRAAQFIMPLLLGLAAVNITLSMMLAAICSLLAAVAGGLTLWAERRAPAPEGEPQAG